MRIALVAPEQYRQHFALSSLNLTLRHSFNQASIEYLTLSQLRSVSALNEYDLLVFPSSHGEDTPYKYFLEDNKISSAVMKYAQKGAIAAF